MSESRFHHKPEDWYTVHLSELREVGFPTTVTKLQLAELLAEKYPNYSFEKVYLLRGRYAQQRRLENAVMALFPVSAFLASALPIAYMHDRMRKLK